MISEGTALHAVSANFVVLDERENAIRIMKSDLQLRKGYALPIATTSGEVKEWLNDVQLRKGYALPIALVNHQQSLWVGA